MACDIKEAYEVDGAYIAPAKEADSENKDVTLQASLKELQDLFASLLKTVETKGEKSVSDVLPETLAALIVQIEEVMDESPQEAGEMIGKFQSFFNELVETHPEAEAQIKTAFSQLFQRYAEKNSENSGKLFQVLYGMGKGATADMPTPPELEESLTVATALPSTAPSKTSGSTLNFNDVFNDPELESLANIFALLSIAIQNLETTVMEQQADKSQIFSEEGQKEVEMAQKQLNDVIDAIKKMEEARKEAKKAGLSSMIIGIAVAVVGVAFAALTMGIGAAIFMAAVGAFMMSPGFSETVQQLSGAMQPALPPHVADMMAKIVILVAIVGLSFGTGLFTASTEVAAEEGSEVVAEEALEAGAEEGVETGAESAGNGASKTDKAWAFAQVQGWTNLAAANPMMDALDAIDGIPKSVKIFLDVLMELLCMVMCFRSGSTLMKMTPGLTSSSGAPEWFVKYFAQISQGVRIGQAGMELGAAASEGYKSYWQFAMADLQKKEGYLNAEGQLMQILIALNSSLQKSTQDATSGALQSLESALQLVQQGAGAAQAKANEVIASA